MRLPSFGRLAWRNLRARRLRALLTAAGIVLGVGLIFGVLLLTSTIDSTFKNLFSSVYGRADLVVSSRNQAGTLREATLERVRAVEDVDRVDGSLVTRFARIEGGEAVEGNTGDLNVAGKDPAGPDTTGATLTAGREIRSGAEITLEERWADDRGIGPGDRLTLGTPAGLVTFDVVGTFRFSRTFGFGGEGFAAIPLDEARRVMNKPRGYDEIAVVVADSANLEAVQAALRTELGEGIDVATPRGKSEEVSDQLRALNVLLLFFAAMGLVVGGLLIFNSFAITVLQRRREIGILRTLGASRRSITGTILREALLLGAVGTALGLALGVGLAAGFVRLMSAIGFPVSGLSFSVVAMVAAIVAGMVVTVLAALVPAWRAGRVPPLRAVLGLGDARRPPSARRAVAGVAISAAGLAGVFVLASAEDVPAGTAAIGMAGVIAIFVGVTLAAPFAIVPLVRTLSWPMRRLAPIEGRLASDSAKANPARTAWTASQLMIGLALVTAFGSLGASFLGTVEEEFDTAFARDLTVQPRGFSPGAGPQQSFSPTLRDRIAALPEAAVVTPERLLFTSDLLPGAGDGLVVAFDPADYGEVDDSHFAGDATEEEVLSKVARGQVTVGEAVAKEEGIDPGEAVALRGPAGSRRAQVAGIVETAIFGGQTLGMSLETMREVYGITTDSDLAVKAVSPEARPALERKIEGILEADYPQLQVLSNDELKADIESQVNQQFGFFNALLAIAVLVSLFGVINTLSMNVLERTREIGVLRALGSSRWQVRRSIGDEGLLITSVGALLGLLVGLALGYVFVRGIAAAVPSVSYVAPVGTIVAVAIAGIVLGLLASILPARRAARMDVIEALAYE